MANINIFDSVISTFDNIKTLKQLQRGQNVFDLETTMKCLYDFTKKQSYRKTKALPELVTKGFDEEQIWQQLELQNESELIHFSHRISEVLAGNKKLLIPVSSAKPESMHAKDTNLREENEDMFDDKESENENEMKSILRRTKHDIRKRKKSSIVDDKFFKLQEMDDYLTKEEKNEKHGENNAGSDDESVDLFNDFSEDENENNAQGKYLKYADFFDSPPSEDDQLSENRNSDHNNTDEDSEEEELDNGSEETSDDEESRKPSKKKVKFNLTNDSDETDSLENKMHKNEKEEDTELKSSLEARQERLRMRIKELEEEAIGEKPWQLQGEVSGPNRPQNSLLEEFVEFDITTRPAPVITEETTMKLEDIIKQRIKDKVWDDVEKKFKPIETPLEYKKKLIMDQEKSKESLSQIYENEYLKQKQSLKTENEKVEEKPELHREVQNMMRNLMFKLDALSNYHYTPKQSKPEIKIISNMPAINIEEVAPVATSDAALLAPEEVKAKSCGDLIGKSERTKTDKKRERRRKKVRQRAKQQAIENKEKLNMLKPGIAKKNKEKAALLKKLTKNRNIIKSDETVHKIAKSSTAFFTQLQDQVKTQIKAKTSSTSKKNNKNAISAVKLKL